MFHERREEEEGARHALRKRDTANTSTRRENRISQVYFEIRDTFVFPRKPIARIRHHPLIVVAATSNSAKRGTGLWTRRKKKGKPARLLYMATEIIDPPSIYVIEQISPRESVRCRTSLLIAKTMGGSAPRRDLSRPRLQLFLPPRTTPSLYPLPSSSLSYPLHPSLFRHVHDSSRLLTPPTSSSPVHTRGQSIRDQ